MGAQNNWIRFKWIMTVLCLVAAVFFLGTGPALGAGGGTGTGDTYYVDIASVDDTGDGSEGDPWKTFHHAFDLLQPGDTLYVQPGTYSVAAGEGDYSPTWYNGSLRIIGNGAPGDVIIDGTGSTSWFNGIRFYDEVSTVSGVVIENLDICNFSSTGYGAGNGIMIEGTARDVLIQNCRIYQNASAGIHLNGSRHRVQGCEIYDNGYDSGTPYPGVGILANSDNNVISDNLVYWSGNNTYPQGVGIDVANANGNHVHSNEVYGHTLGTNPCGIRVMGYGTANVFDNHIYENTFGVYVNDSAPEIHRNFLKDNTTGIYVSCFSYLDRSPQIINNLIVGATATPTTSIGIDIFAWPVYETPPVQVYHNTIYGAALKAIQSNVGGGYAIPPDILYNIFSNTTWGYSIFQATGSANPTIDYNLFFDGGSINYLGDYFIDGSGLQALTSTNLTGSDPLFVGAPNNFRFQTVSPAIDAIATANHNLAVFEDFDRVSRPQDNPLAGGGYDMGCFEAFVFYDPTITWIGGGGDDNWSTTGNWDMARLPINTDRVLIPEGGNVLLDQDATVLSIENHGIATIPSGKKLTVVGTESFAANAPDGTLRGEGTLDVSGVDSTGGNYGTIAPGTSAGTFTIIGYTRADASSRLEIEIGGTGPGMFDKLIINGHLDSAGEIYVSLINEYVPLIGGSFEIMTFDSLTGFAVPVILPPLPDDRIWRQTLDTGSTPNRFVLDVVAANAGGTGTLFDPYLIETPEQLNHVRKLPDRHFKQIANIDLSGYASGMGWDPIGEDGNCFTGIYNGNGYIISQMTINRPLEENVGLFACVGWGGVLKNVTLNTVSVTGYANVGALAGSNSGDIVGCSAYTGSGVVGTSGSITAAGGLVGYNYGRVERSSAGVSVNGPEKIGGLAGYHVNGTISQSYAEGTVSGGAFVGGLAGYLEFGQVVNSYAVGPVSGTNNVGGLAGYVEYTTVTNCYSAGLVTGVGGGLIGDVYDPVVINSYYDTNTSGKSDTGKGEPKITSDMKTGYPSHPTITIYTGWYTFVWDFTPTTSYPVLRWTGRDHSTGWDYPDGLDDTVNAAPWPQWGIMPQVAMDATNGDTLIVWAQDVGSGVSSIFKNEYRTGIGWNGPDSISPSGYAQAPQVAMDGNGNALVVWRQSDGVNVRIYMSEYRSGWTHPAIGDAVSTSGSNAAAPQVAMSDNGEALIVWAQDAGSGASSIFINEYRSEAWGGPTAISPSGYAQAPQVAMDGSGNALVVWQQSDGVNERIYMSEYRSSTWSHPAIGDAVSPSGFDATAPQVAMSDTGTDTGHAVMVWGQSDGIYNRVYMMEYYEGSGWNAPATISPTGSDASAPRVAMSSNGDALIVWNQGEEYSGNQRVFMSEYRPGDGWRHPLSRYNYISPVGYHAENADAAMDGNGNAVIVWYMKSDDIYAGWISMMEYRDGAWRIPANVPPAGEPDYSQPYSPRAAMSNNGEAAVAWDVYLGYDEITYFPVWRVYKAEYRTAQYTLSVDIYPAGEGTVVSSPVGIDCPDTACEGFYDVDTSVDLSAVTSGSLTFAYWLVDGQPDRITGNSLTVVMDSNHVVTAVFSPFAGGIGTEADPFQIETADHLDAVRGYLDSHFILNNDIDLNMEPWVPIGTLDDPFTGVFDGGCNSISNLFIDTDQDYVGLFGFMGPGADVSNVLLLEADVAGWDAVGALAGKNDGGTILVCAVTGTVTGNGSDTGGVGGMVGYNAGTVINSYAAVHVTGTGNYIGGLVGKNNSGIIGNCYSTGMVEGGSNVGGLVGAFYPGTVNNSYWNTETSGQGTDGNPSSVGYTSAQMRQQANFSVWVFFPGGPWFIIEGISFPYLCDGEGIDFGDAQDSPYPTLLVNNGARHTILPGYYLGIGVDSEPEGQPDANALGDDNNNTDDEDGIVFNASLFLGATNFPVTITASANGYIDAWIDFNINGNWDAGEQIFNGEAVTAGANNLTFNIPIDAVLGTTFARFRFSSSGSLLPTGLADDGEVEDYAVEILASVIGPGEYYVDSAGGDDANDGSSDFPWRTLHHAIDMINNGEEDSGTYTLYVASGDYLIEPTGYEPPENLYVTQSYLTIIGDEVNRPRLDGTGGSTGGEVLSSWMDALDIQGATNVTIENLEIQNFAANGIHLGGASECIIDNCDIHDNANSGINIEHGGDPFEASPDNIIQNGCAIYRNGTSGVRIYDSPGNQVIGNTIYGHQAVNGFDGFGIEAVNCSPDIWKNVLYDNSEGVAVLAENGGTAAPNIWNNLIYDDPATPDVTMVAGIILEIEYYDYSGPLCTLSPTIYHNTIDGASAAGIAIQVADLGGTGEPRIEYNIISNYDLYGIANASGFTDPWVMRNDIYSAVTGSVYYTNFTTTPTGDIYLDPLYIDAAARNYRLQIVPSQSPCVDFSTEATVPLVIDDIEDLGRPRGDGYDIGCYEIASSNGAFLNVQAYIDGITHLYIQGSNVWWHQLNDAAPGRIEGLNYQTFLNGRSWYPVWPDVPDAENRFCDCDSSMYDQLAPPLPSNTVLIGITPISARGSVSIIEQPSAANGFTAIIEFNDDYPNYGPAWYNVDINYSAAVMHTVNFIAGVGGSLSGNTSQTVAHGGGTTAVTASPSSGYEFAGWSGIGGTVIMTNPLTISNVTSDMTVTANFTRSAAVTRTVQFIAGAGGTISGNTLQTVTYGGSTSAVTAVPNTGYEFVGWTGGYNGVANPLIISNVTAGMTVTANFRQVPVVETHRVDFIIAGPGGTITGSTAQVVAHGGSTSAVEAVPNTGYEFVGWSGGYTANPLTIFNVTSDMTVYANFRRIEAVTFTVEFIANAGGSIVGNTTQMVEEGGDCTPVTAVANTGYEFASWSGGADGTDATLTVTNVTANMIIYADFREQEPVTYTVMFNAGTGGHISGETAQVVEEGKDCAPVMAVADPGYTFAGWSGDAGGTDASLTVTNVTADMTITALFDENAGNRPPERPLPVSPSEDGVVPPGPMTLRSGVYADPENDPHTRTWWQVTRFGSSDIVYEIQTESDLTSHTVSGLMPGVKYAWRAGYQDAGSGEYTWSDMGVFVVGAPSVDENIPPVDPGTDIGDYRMVSFVSWPVPSLAASVFGPLLPEGYDPALLRIGTYDPILGGYREYPDFSVEPGRSYWFLAREGLDLSVEGIPVSTGVDFCMSLGFNPANGDGWNMIAPPNARHYALGDLVVSATDGAGHTVFGPMPVALLTPDNPYIDVRIWSWAAGDYVASDDPGFVLEAYNGYWVRAKGANVTLCFPADAPVALRSFDSGDDAGSLLGRFSTWIAGILPDIDTAHADASHDNPPMPMSALEDGAGGSKGCFIEAIATEGN